MKIVQRICRDFDFLETYMIFFRDPYYHVYLASFEGKSVGLMVISRHSYNLYGNFLWVDEDYRNKKIGTQLLTTVIEIGKNEGYRSFTGDALSTNTEAHKLYEKIGAVKYGKYTNLYGEGKEIIFMFRIVFSDNLEKNLK